MTDRVSELKLFFSTPVWVSRVKNHEEVNKKILEYIKSLESQNPKGVQKSNSKGWHSQDFDMNADNIKDYINSIGPYINESLVDMGWDLKNQNVFQVTLINYYFFYCIYLNNEEDFYLTIYQNVD